MLRASARLLKPGGRTAFLTIHPAEDLTPAERRRASRDGPVAVATSRPHRQLLEAASYVDVTEVDYSDEFVATQQAWYEQWELHRGELETLLGRETVEERQRERRASAPTIRAGVLRRSLFTARRP